MNTFDPVAAAEELKWLQDHPHFDQKPASILEFLGEGYLDIEAKVRPGLKKALVEIFGEKVNGKRIANFEEAMVTGGIGIGKTTFASIALPYMVHWVICLRDPQDYFNLLPGSRIAFMQMSTSEDQAMQVIFGDIKARIEHSAWFLVNAQYDKKFTKQIRFPGKDIWILPGDSAETTFEGYNILAGILDEMDSHKVTQDKDYADVGFDTIQSRIASRFIDEDTNGHKGLLICIGQMKKGSGFAAKKYKQMKQNPKAHVTRMTIWESLGWHKFLKPDGTRDSFWYDRKRKSIIPDGIAGMVENEDFIEVPNAYKHQFDTNPEKALRDLAGIPPETEDPFISLLDRIEECQTRWHEHSDFGDESPVLPEPTRIMFRDWFQAQNDPRRRAVHIDIATSGNGDALGMAMGYVDRLIETDDGELKEYIVIDALMRVKVPAGQEIMLSDIRSIIYKMKNELGFRISTVTMDGFQSTDTMQQLRKKRYRADYLSVDKNKLPYEDLREAIYERRIEFPKYMTYLNKGDSALVNIAFQELSQLTDTGKKIDHPADGSKDVADCLAGVTTTLMGDRSYRKGVARPSRELTDEDHGEHEAEQWSPVGMGRDIPNGPFGAQGPMPTPSSMGMGFLIPDRLRRR
jgi:hypothetical protein